MLDYLKKQQDSDCLNLCVRGCYWSSGFGVACVLFCTCLANACARAPRDNRDLRTGERGRQQQQTDTQTTNTNGPNKSEAAPSRLISGATRGILYTNSFPIDMQEVAYAFACQNKNVCAWSVKTVRRTNAVFGWRNSSAPPHSPCGGNIICIRLEQLPPPLPPLQPMFSVAAVHVTTSVSAESIQHIPNSSRTNTVYNITTFVCCDGRLRGVIFV